MYNHAPKDYVCPICLGIQGAESNDTLIRPTDIVHRDDVATAFIASFFIGRNDGHVIIVPNEHFENLYDIPDKIISHISNLAKTLALALKEAYHCDGVTLLQNNEPAGDQHAFHYHLHILPRYSNDELYRHITNKRSTTSEERIAYATKVRQVLSKAH